MAGGGFAPKGAKPRLWPMADGLSPEKTKETEHTGALKHFRR
jgi:hypothetical protein